MKQTLFPEKTEGQEDYYLKSNFIEVKDENNVPVKPVTLEGDTRQFYKLQRGYYVKYMDNHGYKVVDVKPKTIILGNKFKAQGYVSK